MSKIFKKLFLVLFLVTNSFFINANSMSAINFKNLTTRQKIGQMIILDLNYLDDGKPVTEINPKVEKSLIKLMRDYGIAGFILFKCNLLNKEQTTLLLEKLQEIHRNVQLELAKEKGEKDAKILPLLICVDQEGGKVERFSFCRNGKKLMDNLSLENPDKAYKKGEIIGKELKELGFNCNFAPVLDSFTNPNNRVISVRSFSKDPNKVATYAESFIKGLKEYKILSTGKHFPGHGDTTEDSHSKLPVLLRSINELKNKELVPFTQMIKKDLLDLMMTAHIALPKIEEKTIKSKDGTDVTIPATFSYKILTELLRKDLRYKGVIITDAMNMGAITNLNISSKEATVKAILAGADIVLMPISIKNENDIDEKLNSFFNYVEKMVNEVEILEKRLLESYNRISELREKCC